MASSISSSGRTASQSGELYYEREGNPSGPAIVFIHGLGGTTNVYQPLVHALQDCDLVRFDWAGHGRSSLPEETSVDSYVEDAKGMKATVANTLYTNVGPAVIGHFGLKDVTVVGHSLGGLVATTLAAKNPSLITRLVLLGPLKAPPDQGRSGARDRAAKVREGGMVAVADTIIGNAFSPLTLKSRSEVVSFGRELLSRQNPEGYALACLSLAESTDPDWAKIQAKTTIVSGSHDKISTPALCQTIAGLLEDARVVTLEDVGHWHTLEAPQEVAQIVKQATDP